METALQSENVKQATKIFEENSDMIRIAICSQVNDKSVIDDIFQNLFLSLVQSPVPSNIENVEGYLRRAIRNDVIDSAIQNRYRRAREQRYARMHMVSIRYDDPEDTVIKAETIQQLFEIIENQLCPREAEAVMQRYRFDRDDGKTAEIMGINKRSVSHYLCTGLKRVRQFIRENKKEQNDCCRQQSDVPANEAVLL